MNKNQVFTGEITGITSQGLGVARFEDRAVPIPDGRIEQPEGLGLLLERPVLRPGHGEYPDPSGKTEML